MYWKEVSTALLWLGQTHTQTHLCVVWTQLGCYRVPLAHLPMISPSPSPPCTTAALMFAHTAKGDMPGLECSSLRRCNVPWKQTESEQLVDQQISTAQTFSDHWRDDPLPLLTTV